MKTLCFTLVALFLGAAVAAADVGLTPKSLTLPNLGKTDEKAQPLSLGQKVKGLLDSGQFSFQNTIGVSFRSGAFGGLSQYYLNTVSYRPKTEKPLLIQAQVGIEHNLYGTPSFGASQGGSARIVVPYVGVFYQPRHNIQIELQFSNMPRYGGYRGGYPY